MPRTARFDDDDVLDAALAAVFRDGAEVTITAIARQLGGPVGSIYHRFGSREELLARLWLRSVTRFQTGLFALAQSDPVQDDSPARHDHPDPHDLLVRMAVHVPRYCRRNRAEAKALTLHRAARLATEGPETVRDAAAHLNDGLDALTRQLTRQRYGTAAKHRLDLVITATRVCPYGLVRPYLGRPVPARVDETTRAAADAILRLGDS